MTRAIAIAVALLVAVPAQGHGRHHYERRHHQDAPQSHSAGRLLLIRGLMDYAPGISPMTSLAERLEAEGYQVTLITHLSDRAYIDQHWDAVIGHSMGAIAALRDAPELARQNPHLAVVTIDPPQTSPLFPCVDGVRYLNLHTSPAAGLGGGTVVCPGTMNIDMGGLHIMLPMRTDAQDRVLAWLQPEPEPDPPKPKPPKPTLVASGTTFVERWEAIGDLVQ